MRSGTANRERSSGRSGPLSPTSRIGPVSLSHLPVLVRVESADRLASVAGEAPDLPAVRDHRLEPRRRRQRPSALGEQAEMSCGISSEAPSACAVRLSVSSSSARRRIPAANRDTDRSRS